jgi:hypothetical protein
VTNARHGLPRAAALILALTLAVLVAAALPDGSPAQSGGVLVVGDSLEVGTGPYLRRELGSTPLTIDAKTGRPSSVGLGVLSSKLKPSDRVVVFDLGVNDDPSQPGLLAHNLEAVKKMVGARCLVVSTLSRPPLNGVTIEGMNREIQSFVSGTAGAQLFDWHAATQSDPGLLGPDHLHPGPAGYAARARMLAGVIGSCLSAGAAAKPDDSGIPKPRNPDAKPPPRAPTTARARATRTAWADLLLRLPYRSVVTIEQSGLDRVERAAHEIVGAISPQPAEPTLGTAKSPAGGRARGRTAKPPQPKPPRKPPRGED